MSMREMHGYGVFQPIESIAGVFGCVGCILRIVWVHETFTSGLSACYNDHVQNGPCSQRIVYL